MTRPLTSEVRKPIPLKVQVVVLKKALRLAWGLPDDTVIHIDHRPPLADRTYHPDRRDYDPPQHDPAFLEAISDATHDKRTNGPGGEKRITTLGSDAHNRKRVRDLSAGHAEFVRRLLTKDISEQRPPSRWPKRKFPTRRK